MSDKTGSTEPRSKAKRSKLARILGYGTLLILLIAGGVSFYVWQLGAEARTVYKLGSTLNKFLGDYSTGIKHRNVDEVLNFYDEAYANEGAGDWKTDQPLWEDTKSGPAGARVLVWSETDKRPFSKEDVRGQIEELLGQGRYFELAKFKIESIEKNDKLKSAQLKTLLWLRGTEENGEKVETHAHFRLWLVDNDGWKIKRQDLLYGVTVRAGGTGFADVTEAAGINFEAHHNPMLDEEEWRPKVFEIMQYAHGGVTAADYDKDGWYDIFFTDGSNSRLYRNQGDGTFADVTIEAGLPDNFGAVPVALFADLDNDGDSDLFTGRSTGENRLFRNEGDGTFTDVTEGANLGGLWVAVASAADYNNDGKLDLYLGRYLDPRVDLPTTLFYTRNSAGNSLLRNDGDLKFTDVTAEAGVREGGLSLGVSWGDYDSDGNLDLYVANDFGRNALFRNRGDGTFADVSLESGTIDVSYGMSSTFADLDNDNDLDIFVSNVHSGQRWFGNEATLKNYFVTSLKQGTIREDKELFEELFQLLDGNWGALGDRVIRGNSLFTNNGDGTFGDATEETRTNPHGWYWGSVIYDYDNDGLQDIYAVNGWITGKIADDL